MLASVNDFVTVHETKLRAKLANHATYTKSKTKIENKRRSIYVRVRTPDLGGFTRVDK